MAGGANPRKAVYGNMRASMSGFMFATGHVLDTFGNIPKASYTGSLKFMLLCVTVDESQQMMR